MLTTLITGPVLITGAVLTTGLTGPRTAVPWPAADPVTVELGPEVAAAIITAAVAVTGVILGQVLIWWRESRIRSSERYRRTLMDVQDAALHLRGRLRDYGRALEDDVHASEPQITFAPSVPPTVESAKDDADSLLDVCLTRVRSDQVREAVVGWREAAMSRFISPDEVSAADEADAWHRMNGALGQALTDS
ncbi:MAG: hypothetical protein ACRC35_00540 [Angustibacter sp.]